MNKEDLIHRWKNNTLSSEELELLKSMPEYQNLSKTQVETIDNQLPPSDKKKTNPITENNKASETTEEIRSIPTWKYLASAIALCLIVFIAWQIINNKDITDIHTGAEEELALDLPDGSSFILREHSHLSYSEDWSTNQQVELSGEAYFNVVKGSGFYVNTDHGKISVSGTQFSVRSESNELTVICDEGSVMVDVHDSTFNAVLLADHSYHLTENTLIHISDTKTRLKNYEYKKAAMVIENIYKVKIEEGAWLARGLVSCDLPHHDLVAALDALYIPFKVKYEMSEDGIISIVER